MVLAIASLLDTRFYPAARDAWSGDRVVSYHVDRRASAAERRYLRDAFAQLSRELAIGFQPATGKASAEIRLRPVRNLADPTPGFDLTGETRVSYGTSASGQPFATATVIWQRGRRAVIQGAKRQTVLHEIGHALGLRHADDDPFDPAIDSSQTVMSYNLQGFSGWYTATDLAALRAIWGSPSATPSATGF